MRLVEERLGAVETLLTERRGHATELAASAVGDAVFVLGGDGVVNEVVNGLPAGKPLGVIAGGHTNVFARAIGAPEDPAAAQTRAPDLAGAGQRAEVCLCRRDRRRLGGGPRAGHDPARPGRPPSRRPRLRAGGGAAPALRLRAAARARGSRPRGARLRLERRRVLVRGAGPAALLARGAVRARSRRDRARARRPGDGAAACRPARRSAAASPAHRACSRCTTPTGSSFAATSRCRSRRTARTSAT